MRSKEISVWDLFAILNRHKTAFVLTVLVVVALTICANAYLPRKYRSEAHLLVRLGRENLGLDSTLKLTEQPAVNVTQSREFELNTVANMVKQHSILEKVVDEIGPGMILGDDEGTIDQWSAKIFGNKFMSDAFAPSYQVDQRVNAIRSVAKDTKVRVIPETHMVGIYYDDNDPQLAQRVVDAFVRHALAHHAESHRVKGSVDFIVAERDQSKVALETAENELGEFKKNTGLVSVGEQRAAAVGRVSNLKAQQLDTLSSLSAIKNEISALEQALANLEKVNVAQQTSGAGNRAIDQMRSDLYKLQIREEELISKYKPNNPLVVQIKQQIEAAEKILETEEGKIVQKTYSPSREYQETNILLIQKKSQHDALHTKSTKLGELLENEEQALQQLDADALSIKRMEREIDLLAENYNRYAREAELARVDNSLGQTKLTNLSVEQAATLDRYPVFPNVKLNLAIGTMLALFFGGLACVILETWSKRQSTSNQDLEPASQDNGSSHTNHRNDPVGNGHRNGNSVQPDIDDTIEEMPDEPAEENANIRIPR